jgi:hypothetical protein
MAPAGFGKFFRLSTYIVNVLAHRGLIVNVILPVLSTGAVNQRNELRSCCRYFRRSC